MLCFYLTVGFPWSAPVLSRLLGAGRGHAPSEPPSAPTARPRRGGGPRARRSWGDPREGPGARPESPPRTATTQPRQRLAPSAGRRAGRRGPERAVSGEIRERARARVQSRGRAPPLPSPARAAHTV